jgi:serine/threonine protein kinase/tetratricopeptide (TPR) repeat protein
MNHKTNEDKVGPTDAWLKTITDMPATDAGKKAASVIKSPYAVPEMPPEVKIGEVLGSGTILKVLGEGGFARVYKIHDDKLDMDRAVKVLLPTGKKEVSDRFLTEARITARLDNPNIVKVFRVDEWHGCPFIEMEYIDGKSLETILQERGTFPVYGACAVGIFIASALKYAHTMEFTLSDQHYKGVIHRDLKPANIMLHSDGRLKLMDFGIARPISTGLHTMGENIVGTLQYLSPEQLNHKGIDQRTDLYAVGAILYELLCGIKAFPDEGLTDLVNKKAGGIYKPFGEFPVSIPKKLIEIVDTCLQVDKEERYNSAEALIDALTAVYTQYSSVEPLVALKNFMENPDYSPPAAKSAKKKQSTPRVAMPQLHLPKMPQISLPRLPEFHFPKIPKPKLPRLQLPKEQLFKLQQSVINGVKNVIAVVLRFLMYFWTIPKQIVTTIVNRIKQIPKNVYKIGAFVFAGIIVAGVVWLIVRNQFTGKETASSKQIADDTVVAQVSPPVPADSGSVIMVPVLLSPASDETWKSETLQVLWNRVETADSFIVQIASGEEFADTIHIQTVSGDTSCAIIDIEPGKYYCRIGVAGENGTNVWCAPRFFKYSPVYHTPHLVAPSSGDTCTDREVSFQWRKVPKAKGYLLNVAIDSTFTQLVFNDTNVCRDTFINVIFHDTALVTYYWHVRTNDTSSWSSVHIFTVNDKKDYHAEAAKALRKGRLSSAEKALSKIGPSDPYRDTLAVRLAGEYLKAKNFEKVNQILASVVLKDMMVEYLRGQVLINEGNYVEACAVLDAAIGLNTCFASRVDSSNVVYLRAVAVQKIYDAKKDPQKGSRAYYAWDSVKKIYDTDQASERYREALVKMNQLYHTDKVFGTDADTLKKKLGEADSLKQPTDKKKKNSRSFRLKPL